MIIIKLGGSVITNKSKLNSLNTDNINRLASEIKKANKKAIIIHGAGSFGHIHAKKYDLNNGFKDTKQIMGFAETHVNVQKLNTKVIELLQRNCIPAVSISPHSIMKLDNHKPIKFDYDIFKDCLKQGFMPVSFGDVVLDKTLGFSICSGDLLVQILSKNFKIEKTVFVIDEDGLYSSNPKIDKKAKFIVSSTIEDLEKLSVSMDSHPDVTKGMKGKIDTIKNIAEEGIDTYLLNGNKPGTLYKVLIGESTKCSKVIGVKK